MQAIATNWAIKAFGVEHVLDGRVRALRFLEEAVELAQALGVTKQKVVLLLDTVYNKPPGDKKQEIGGSFLTLLVLCSSTTDDPETCLENELFRVLQKPIEEFAERNKTKIHFGLD